MRNTYLNTAPAPYYNPRSMRLVIPRRTGTYFVQRNTQNGMWSLVWVRLGNSYGGILVAGASPTMWHAYRTAVARGTV